jgi:F0F1-type ATP synthase membrane subunit b/b'
MIQSVVLKSVLSFCGKYWREIGLVCLLFAVFGKSHLDYKRLEKAYETSQDSLKNQIANLKELHADELERRDQALDEYRETIEELEKEHSKQLADLERDTQEQREEIVDEIVERNQFSENKDELAEKVQVTFGFEYVP